MGVWLEVVVVVRAGAVEVVVVVVVAMVVVGSVVELEVILSPIEADRSQSSVVMIRVPMLQVGLETPVLTRLDSLIHIIHSHYHKHNHSRRGEISPVALGERRRRKGSPACEVRTWQRWRS